MSKYKEFRKEMRERGRRLYWQINIQTAWEILGGVALFILFIAVVYGYMLVFPD